MNASSLRPHDLQQCIRRLPPELVTLMKQHPGEIMIGGGFIRSCIFNERANDIDVFVKSRADAEGFAKQLSAAGRSGGRATRKIHESPFAFSIHEYKPMIQIIHRWTFENCQEVVESFDFTCCAAAFTYGPVLKANLGLETMAAVAAGVTENRWNSSCDPEFYSDLAAKRLTYRAPDRQEEPGGSTLRVLKYYQRGFRIPLDSLSLVLARLMRGVVKGDKPWREMMEYEDEYPLAKVLCGLLREVDPAIDPQHEAHLPASADFANHEKPSED